VNSRVLSNGFNTKVREGSGSWPGIVFYEPTEYGLLEEIHTRIIDSAASLPLLARCQPECQRRQSTGDSRRHRGYLHI